MIGSQALTAEPRATVPSPRPGAGGGQPVGDAEHATVVVAPIVGVPTPDRALRRGEPQPVDELRLLVRAQEQVDRRIPTPQPAAIRLADGAAGQHDPHRRVGGLEPRQLSLPADDLLLRALADRAGVDDDEVGRVHRRRLVAAGRQEATGHLLRVAAVHLAAQRPDVEARQAADPDVLAEPVVGRRRGQAGRGAAGALGGGPRGSAASAS